MVRIHTKRFTFDDVYRLAGIMHYQYGLVVNVQRHKGKPVIYIPSAYMGRFIALVEPHFHQSITYKLSGLKQKSSSINFKVFFTKRPFLALSANICHKMHNFPFLYSTSQRPATSGKRGR